MSTIAVVGACGVPEESDRGIHMFRRMPHEFYWRPTGFISSTTPIYMTAIPHRNLLFTVHNDHVERGIITSFLTRPDDPISLCSRSTGFSNAYHLCIDNHQNNLFAIHRSSVTRLRIQGDGTVGEAVETTDYHSIIIGIPTPPVEIFIPPYFELSSVSIQRVFAINSDTVDLSDVHIYVKFREPVPTELSQFDTGTSSYLTYVINTQTCTISVYSMTFNEMELLQLLKPFSKNWVGASVISDSIAPLGTPFLFVANCKNNSINVFRVLFDGNLECVSIYYFPNPLSPKRLFYLDGYLHVATQNSIVILKVENEDSTRLGMLTFFRIIDAIPEPNCMFFA